MVEDIIFNNRPSVLNQQTIIRRRHSRKRFTFLLSPLILVAFLTLIILVASVSLSSISNEEDTKMISSAPRPAVLAAAGSEIVKPAPQRRLSVAAVTQFLRPHMSSLRNNNAFLAKCTNGETLTITTSLDLKLQEYLRNVLYHSMAAAGAAVAINPEDGTVLSLVDFGGDGDKPLYLSALPAASIFKIITAASALESTELSLLSKIPYNGQKHTLYWSNLSTRVTRHTNYVTFEKAFAQSINPVFAKIGMYHVGPDKLTALGEKFGFNKPFPTDLPVETSQLIVPSSSFEVAEMASGYNKVTLISPVHAAWIACVILNRGCSHFMGVVNQVKSDRGDVLYEYKSEKLQSIVSQETSNELQEMMRCTVLEGTARRSFCRWQSKIREGTLDVGGKTGSINNYEDTIRYDWFVGYGKGSSEKKSIVIAVVLLHGKRAGIKAHKVAQLLIQQYFHL
jgi:penicillin-binding protein A